MSKALVHKVNRFRVRALLRDAWLHGLAPSTSQGCSKCERPPDQSVSGILQQACFENWIEKTTYKSVPTRSAPGVTWWIISTAALFVTADHTGQQLKYTAAQLQHANICWGSIVTDTKTPMFMSVLDHKCVLALHQIGQIGA